jgi:alkyldihydroxyacetonephosphate synthase
MPKLFLGALTSAKASLDPQGILNPGVLIDPENRQVGVTGVMENHS